MEADKSSFPKRELGLRPKFTTKDSHRSFPRSHSYNRPTNHSESETPGAKDLAALHNTKQTVREAGANGPRGWSERSAVTGRTVRNPRVDSPKNATEPPEAHPKIRTVRSLPAYCPRATCAERMVRDLQADGPPNHLPQNFGTSKDPRANSQELDEHAMNTERADSPRDTSGQSVGLEQNSPSSKT
jgi:hypothetical protein